MSGGTGTISLATALSNLGNQKFDWIAGPYVTAQNLTDAQTFLADSGSGRWSPTVGLGGHYITWNDGNLSAQTTLGTGRNDKHVNDRSRTNQAIRASRRGAGLAAHRRRSGRRYRRTWGGAR